MNNLLDRTSVQPSESVAPTARNQWVMPVFEARLLRLESANGSSGRPAFVGRPTSSASSLKIGSHRRLSLFGSRWRCRVFAISA